MSVEKENQDTYPFFLVESREVETPTDSPDRDLFRFELKNTEAFQTDFFGASEEDCQSWALQQMERFNFIEQDIIAILDKHSVTDGSLLIKYYRRSPGFQLPGFDALLPPEKGRWYTFRVLYPQSSRVHADLIHTAPDVTYPFYFGRKDELTDKNGIFDVDKAVKLSIGEEVDITEESM